MYASACVLKSKVTCIEKLDYSEEKVRRFNLTLSSRADCAQRQDTGQDVWSQIRVQWMTITSFVPCYAPHVQQHVAVSLFGPLNQIMISSTPSAETDCISGLGISRQTVFNNNTQIALMLIVQENLAWWLIRDQGGQLD